MEQGWFTRANQDKPAGTLDFLSKVDCVPRSVVRGVATHFREGATPDEIVSAVGNTRKVVLSALYKEVLRRLDTPSTRAEELVRSTEAGSVTRLDIVARILELNRVFRIRYFLSCADLYTDGQWG